jgi:hypothetical protein
LTNSGETWTVNDFRGKFIVITGGTGSGQQKVIVSNTATALTIAGTWTAPTGTSTYAIQQPGANITAPASLPALPGSASISGPGLLINGMEANLRQSTLATAPIDINQLGITPSSGNGIQLEGAARVHVKLCRITTTGAVSAVLSASGSPAVGIEESSFINAVNGSGVAQGSLSSPVLLNVSNSYLRGGGNGSGFGTTSNVNRLVITSTQIENYGFQISLSGQVGNAASTSIVLDCNSIAASAGIGSISPAATGGVGSFGLIATTGVINNCPTGVSLIGPGKFVNLAGVWSGSSVTTAISVSLGGQVQLSSTATLVGGTTDITVDGTTFTIAAMRAASPKIVSNAIYGSAVFE